MQFLRHMKIAQKLMVSFSVLIAVVILTAVVSFSSISDIQKADYASEDADNLDDFYQLYRNSFAEERQGLLYYILTGDRTSLAKYEEISAVTAKHFKGLQEQASDNKEILVLVTQLSKLYNDWKTKFADVQIRLMRNHLTVNQARAIEVTGMPQEVIDEFERTADNIAEKLEVIVNDAIKLKNDAVSQLETTVLSTIAILIATAVGASFLLTKEIGGPIGRITQMMEALASGQLDLEVHGSDRKDEIGGMAKAVEVFKQNAIAQRELQIKETEQKERSRVRHAKMEQLAKDFDEKMGTGLSIVADSVSNVMSSATTMAGNATETGVLSQDASAAIEEASTNIHTVSTASAQLSSSISEISQQMLQTSEVSRAAVDEIERTNAKVIALNEAANSIGQVVQIISDIAEQTNLLALNATIEAARAGEAGKGFAVVANEVKNLATQTGKATEEIDKKVNEIQHETGAAAEAVLSIGDTIRKIDELTTVVSSAVEQQGAATSEIARNVEEAAQGANHVSSVVHSVSTAADETGRLAEGQKVTVEELGKNNEVLKNDISAFLNAVKSL